MATPPIDLSAKRVIVGGGIAGLSAAYVFVKAGCKHVTVLESSFFLGGVVRSATIKTAHNVGVDFGASEVAVDDMNLLTVCDELKIRDLLHVVDKPKVITPEVNNPNEYALIETWQDMFTHHQFSAFIGKTLEVGLLTPGVSLSYYYPNQEKFGNTTLAEFLDGFDELKDVISRSFLALGYGRIEEMPLFLGLPLLTKPPKTLSFSGRTHILVDALATYIQTHGGHLRTGCKVVGVQMSDKKQTAVEVKNAVSGRTERVVCDQLLWACPIDRIPTNVFSMSLPLHASNPVHNPTVQPEYRYTHTMVALVQVNDIPLFGAHGYESTEWSTCFQTAYTSDMQDKVQLVRVENCTPLLHNSSELSVPLGESPTWLKLHFDMRDSTLTKFLRQHSNQSIQAVSKLIQTTLGDVPLFKSNNTRLVLMLHYEVIQRRHPILNGAAVYEMHHKSLQGVNNVWFAGQYMGTTGSLETACFTGRRAAYGLLGSTQLADFDARTRRSEQDRINGFRWKVLGVYGAAATGLALGVACAFIGTKLVTSDGVPAAKQDDTVAPLPQVSSQSISRAVVDHAASTSSILEDFRKNHLYNSSK